MKKQFLLASVSVIAALAVTSAYAGDLNQTNINQTGTNGQVIIDQTGDGNIAGTSSTDPKAVPSISNSLVQAGKNESLSVTQSGINNTFRAQPRTIRRRARSFSRVRATLPT
jgi:opacity protein-like surface antigen